MKENQDEVGDSSSCTTTITIDEKKTSLDERKRK